MPYLIMQRKIGTGPTTAESRVVLDATGITTFIPDTVTNGTQLYLSGSPWNDGGPIEYQNLPAKLQNQWGFKNVNGTNAYNVTFTDTVDAYMIRSTTWNNVNLTGWTLDSSLISYMTAALATHTTEIRKRTYTAGTYSFDSYSGVYIFTLPA